MPFCSAFVSDTEPLCPITLLIKSWTCFALAVPAGGMYNIIRGMPMFLRDGKGKYQFFMGSRCGDFLLCVWGVNSACGMPMFLRDGKGKYQFFMGSRCARNS